MKTTIGLITLVFLTFSVMAAEPNTPEYLYQKALNLETAKADYQGAIAIYETIIKENERNENFVAKALYRMGVCREKTGAPEKAKECAIKLTERYQGKINASPEMREFVGRYRKTGMTDGGNDPQDQIMAKMKSIVIPEVNFENAKVTDALKWLTEQSEKNDKNSPAGSKGVNFIFNISPSEAPTVSMQLRNASLFYVVQYITETTGLKCSVKEHGVIIMPAGTAYGGIVTRTYKVLESMIKMVAGGPAQTAESTDGQKSGVGKDDVLSAKNRPDIKQFFMDAGIPFPEGTSIMYLPEQNLLIVKNTTENLAMFERLLAKINIPPLQVRVQVDHVEITDPETAKLFRARVPAGNELRGLRPDAYRKCSSLSAVAKSGSAASSGNAPVTLNVRPLVGPDNETIDLTINWKSKTSPGVNSSDMEINQTLTIWDGCAIVLQAQRQEPGQQEVKNPQFLLITATLIAPNGRPIKNASQQKP